MAPVLVVVIDGLQPAQVRADLAPNLARFAGEGVFFSNHHSAYPSVTRVNAASIVTGKHAGGHGLAGNMMVSRGYDEGFVFPEMEPTFEGVAHRLSRVLSAPTLADMLSVYGMEYAAVGIGSSGMEYAAIGAGTLGNAWARIPRGGHNGGVSVTPELSKPRCLAPELESRFGPWPAEAAPSAPRLEHAVRILTEHVLPERRPAVTLLWSSEPDETQHDTVVGGEVSNAALRAADDAFGLLLDWLDGSAPGAETDVLVVSDHGYSTIREVVDIEAGVRQAGFGPHDVVVAPNGASVLFYTGGPDVAGRLAEWLMTQPWCGALLASDRVGNPPGTLSQSLAGCEGPNAPDLLMSFAWDPAPNEAGYCGRVYAAYGGVGHGQHGSMGASEMNNTLIARGPSFKRGVRVASPTGNIDITPTVLRLLGLPASDDTDGRVLVEALEGGPDTVDWSCHVITAEREVGGRAYSQYVRVSRVGTTTYLDEGNGRVEELSPEDPAPALATAG